LLQRQNHGLDKQIGKNAVSESPKMPENTLDEPEKALTCEL